MDDDDGDVHFVGASGSSRGGVASGSGSGSWRASKGGRVNGSSMMSAVDEDKLAALETEMAEVEEEIKQRRELLKSLRAEKMTIMRRYESGSQEGGPSAKGDPLGKRPASGVDYTQTDFPWSGELLPRAKATWPAVQKFRLVQEAVCNAALDGRDTVVVMPTGGGKSLCYQLPAILDPGLTLVVSPLISLSMDQLWHLREAGVNCEMLSSAVSREDSNDILRRIKQSGRQPGKDDIKVLFVTPEKVAHSKALLAALQQCFQNERLARIVIDEAHCCSQMGHDFRPDYKKLAVLRNLYPGVPIMCLSATLSPQVLQDVRTILNLPKTTEPHDAAPDRTVYFTAPLYRPNLKYSVVSRPSASKDSAAALCDWILEHHAGESGIVYTLSRKDSEVMAGALEELSNGRIRAGWYHADLSDSEKTNIHQRWRSGRIQVVAATIAFGMGIDKGDVRFVAHASCGKSLDSYYQETGRAGRDGGDADCVLFYRPQDATRVSSLLARDPTGQAKLHSMLEYAQSSECRKRLFGRYFQSFGEDEDDCGECDNCRCPPERQDVSFEAWQMLRVIEEVHGEGGRVSLAQLCDLARGLGGGQYTVLEGGGGRRKGKRRKSASSQSGFLRLDETCGGKLALSKDNAERLAVELLLRGYLGDEFNATAYSVNVYVRPATFSVRLTRHDLEAARNLKDVVVMTLFGREKRSAKGGGEAAASKKQKTGAASTSKAGKGASKTPATKRAGKAKASTAAAAIGRKRKLALDDSEDDDDDDGPWDDDDSEDEAGVAPASRRRQNQDDTIEDSDAEAAGRWSQRGRGVAAMGIPKSKPAAARSQMAPKLELKPKAETLSVGRDAKASPPDVKWQRGFADDPVEIDDSD